MVPAPQALQAPLAQRQPTLQAQLTHHQSLIQRPGVASVELQTISHFVKYGCGHVAGYVVWNKSGMSLDAHCMCDGHGRRDCKPDRSVKANGRRKAQGRPLGFLLSWLQVGLWCKGSRDTHVQLKMGKGRIIL